MLFVGLGEDMCELENTQEMQKVSQDFCPWL